ALPPSGSRETIYLGEPRSAVATVRSERPPGWENAGSRGSTGSPDRSWRLRPNARTNHIPKAIIQLIQKWSIRSFENILPFRKEMTNAELDLAGKRCLAERGTRHQFCQAALCCHDGVLFRPKSGTLADAAWLQRLRRRVVRD